VKYHAEFLAMPEIADGGPAALVSAHRHGS
jgi:hypothetical protein